LRGHLEVIRRPLDEGFELLFLQHCYGLTLGSVIS
jgi:hypothetical protein